MTTTATRTARINCGKCHETHSSAAEVRNCYFPPAPAAPVAAPIPTEVRGQLITERQLAYLETLLEQRPSFRDVENLWTSNLTRLSKRDASQLISRVLEVPREVYPTTAPAAPAPAAPATPTEDHLDTVQDGRYALGTDENAKFYQVTTARHGGRNVYRLAGAPGNWRKHKLYSRMAAAILEQIAQEPAEAMVRFGRTFGVCGRCVSPLSDAVSRARFIGPDCAVTMGLESHGSYADRHPELDSVY